MKKFGSSILTGYFPGTQVMGGDLGTRVLVPSTTQYTKEVNTQQIETSLNQFTTVVAKRQFLLIFILDALT